MTWRKSNVWPLGVSLFLHLFSLASLFLSSSSASAPTHSLSLLLYSLLAHPAFSLSHTLAAIYKGMPKFCATSHKRWMNDLLRLCDCVMCVLRGCECIDAAYACLCEIWCKQNKLSCCSAVFLMFCPKITTQTHSKTHFLCRALSSLSPSPMFKWLSLASNTKVRTGETNPAHANNMRLL